MNSFRIRSQFTLIALVALSSVSFGQATIVRQQRLNAVLAAPVSGAALAAATGLDLTGEIPGVAVSLQQPINMPNNEFARLLKIVNDSPDTLFAELDRRIQIPEFEGCAITGQVGVQQCTIGFVSGSGPGDNCSQNELPSEFGLGPLIQEPPTSVPVIAVIDSGVEPSLPIFADSLLHPGYDHVLDQPGGYERLNGVDEDNDGLIDEAAGHGTHVATTILSLAPDALILPVRVVDAEGIGYGFDVAEGLLSSINDGVDIINLSLSMSAPSELVNLTLALALSRGIEVYAAAGNTGLPSVLFPASFQGDPTGTFQVPTNMPSGVIGVAALSSSYKVLPFSSHGASVDLCGLGSRVCAQVSSGAYEAWQGTSMACATTSGVAALIRSRIPDSYQGPMSELLISTARPVDDENPGLEGKLGAGAFDVFAAVAAANATAP